MVQFGAGVGDHLLIIYNSNYFLIQISPPEKKNPVSMENILSIFNEQPYFVICIKTLLRSYAIHMVEPIRFVGIISYVRDWSNTQLYEHM